MSNVVSLEADNEIDAGLHFHTDIHIAALMLLTTLHGAEKAQCANPKLGAELVSMGFDEVNIFACLFHRKWHLSHFHLQ